jgi:hypothetical protein
MQLDINIELNANVTIEFSSMANLSIVQMRSPPASAPLPCSIRDSELTGSTVLAVPSLHVSHCHITKGLVNLQLDLAVSSAIDPQWVFINNTFINSTAVVYHPQPSGSLFYKNRFEGNRCTSATEKDSVTAALCPALVSGVEGSVITASTSLLTTTMNVLLPAAVWRMYSLTNPPF